MLLFICRGVLVLAWHFRVSIHLMLLFIVIKFRGRTEEVGFNTSHVTLYLCLNETEVTEENSFNTSHVTLYR